MILANLPQYAIIARMIPRRIEALVRDRLGHMPAVALLGPRQVGKTTLAHAIAEGRRSVYLALEPPLDRENSRTRRSEPSWPSKRKHG
jgi:predicted AAA+ superfamily ATPase